MIMYSWEAENLDIFDVLSAISRIKINLMKSGLDAQKALIKAQKAVSKEYHIPLPDIRKLVGNKINPKI